MILNALKSRVIEIVTNTNETVEKRLFHICELLESNIDYYNWVGFYFKNGNKEELKLGPYVGAPTNHTIIPFGKGICGQVALSNQNFVVKDVSEQDNYLACNINVKSEIVVPIFINGKNIGQIDIDSDTINPFTKVDVSFLEFICAKVSEIL
jgi:L-methionine (R)-S-oxide reductase